VAKSLRRSQHLNAATYQRRKEELPVAAAPTSFVGRLVPKDAYDKRLLVDHRHPAAVGLPADEIYFPAIMMAAGEVNSKA